MAIAAREEFPDLPNGLDILIAAFQDAEDSPCLGVALAAYNTGVSLPVWGFTEIRTLFVYVAPQYRRGDEPVGQSLRIGTQLTQAAMRQIRMDTHLGAQSLVLFPRTGTETWACAREREAFIQGLPRLGAELSESLALCWLRYHP